MFSISLQSVLAKLFLQMRIVSAVARRELQLKTAKGVLGVAGLLLGPLIVIAVILFIRVYLRSVFTPYLNPVLWISLGVITVIGFLEISVKAIDGVGKNSDLHFYRRVRPLDSLMGNALLQAQIYGTLILFIVFSICVWEWKFVVQDLGLLIMLYLGVVAIAFGVGLSSLVIGHRYPVVGWLVKTLVRRILFFTSCTFFGIAQFPDVVRPWILWNPLAHGVELMRAACNPSYPIPGVSPVYFWCFVVGSLGLSFVVYGNNEELLYAPKDQIDFNF